jgi:DNA-binding XRE family transcriptional regulator
MGNLKTKTLAFDCLAFGAAISREVKNGTYRTKTAVAQALGISRTTLYDLLKCSYEPGGELSERIQNLFPGDNFWQSVK